MKSKIMLFLLALLPIASFAQNKAIDNIFDKFDGKPGITSINISKEMMNLVAQLDSLDFKAKELFSQINNVRILALNKASQEDKTSFDTMVKAIQLSTYKELMVVKDKGNTVKILTLQNEGKINQFLLLVTGDHESVIISINGNINPKDLGKLASLSHFNGFKYFDHMNHNK